MEQIMFSMWNDVPIRFPTLACGGNEDFSALSGPYPEHRRKLHYQEHSEISTRATRPGQDAEMVEEEVKKSSGPDCFFF